MLGDKVWFRVSSPCPIRCLCGLQWTTSCWKWKRLFPEVCQSQDYDVVWSWRSCRLRFFRFGGRCTQTHRITPLNGLQEVLIQSTVHPPDNWSPLAPSTPLWDLCVSAAVDSCPGPALLGFTLMFNPILTVSSFSPRSRSASHEYPKVCLLDRIIPLFKATGDNNSTTKKHTQWIFFSLALFLSLSFALSLPSVFVPLGFH